MKNLEERLREHPRLSEGISRLLEVPELDEGGAERLIGQMDGSLIPIVTTISWWHQQQERLREGQAGVVLETLSLYLEAADVGDREAPVRCCYRYLNC